MLRLYTDNYLFHNVQNKQVLQDPEFLRLHIIQLRVKKLFLVRLLIDKIISQKLHKLFSGLHLKIPAKKENLI